MEFLFDIDAADFGPFFLAERVMPSFFLKLLSLGVWLMLSPSINCVIKPGAFGSILSITLIFLIGSNFQ